MDVRRKRQKAQPAYTVTWLHLWSPASSIQPIAVKRLSAPSGPSRAARTPVFSQWSAATHEFVGKKTWVVKTGSAAKGWGVSRPAQRVGGWYETWPWHGGDVHRASREPLLRQNIRPSHEVWPCPRIPSRIMAHRIS